MADRENSEKLAVLQSGLGYNFQDMGLLETALTHKSFINETTQKGVLNNERLEFLGDAVLGLVITDFLIHRFPEYSEGDLSKLKGFVVSRSSLFELATELDLGKYLKLGRGELNTGGRHKRSILADSFEAVIAGIYLDGGFKAAYDFIIRQMGEKILGLAQNTYIPDYKTILQEHTQMMFGCVPKYEIVSEKGEDHDPEFEVCILIKDNRCGCGRGKSKREAEQDAAHNALINLNIGGINSQETNPSADNLIT
ncbi:ribonuclease III [bacterium]|nr:ribonuclease III [bacterium]